MHHTVIWFLINQLFFRTNLRDYSIIPLSQISKFQLSNGQQLIILLVCNILVDAIGNILTKFYRNCITNYLFKVCFNDVENYCNIFFLIEAV
jgi:hypothetical protein